ncbi:MAG TPA: rhomboid family intramembrane serine protease [Candidatus Limnocylindria bacterium]|nr:rhomboid family intramembrane serine protease [Candidatus Limnocylindria bacterium]
MRAHTMLPIGDDDTPSATFPIVNLALIAINVAVFLYQLLNPDFTNGFSTVPAEITTGRDIVGQFAIALPDGTSALIDEARGPSPIWLTLVTSMFMHGGWTHLGGNMLFLFIFGDNVEKSFGHLRYLAFYLGCGLVASLAQVYSGPDSIVPSLGASGAIAGVLAAYLVLFPANRVRVLLGYFVTTVPAVAMIGLWALIQLVSGFGSTSVSAETGGVAYLAHIGGFIAGLVLAFVLRPFSDRGVGPHVVGYPRRGTFG